MCLVNNNDTDRAIVLLYKHLGQSGYARSDDNGSTPPNALRGLGTSLPESAAIREVTLGLHLLKMDVAARWVVKLILHTRIRAKPIIWQNISANGQKSK